jgi:hypothetical protein
LRQIAFLAVKRISRAELSCGNVKPEADLPEATKPNKQSATSHAGGGGAAIGSSCCIVGLGGLVPTPLPLLTLVLIAVLVATLHPF